MSYYSASPNNTLSSSHISSLSVPRPPLSLPWSTSRRSIAADTPPMSNRVWPQWEEINYNADANTSFEHAMEGAEDVDEVNDDIAQKQGLGCRNKFMKSLHGNMNIRSEINRTRIDSLHKTIAWADLMIRFRYTKPSLRFAARRRMSADPYSPTTSYDHFP